MRPRPAPMPQWLAERIDDHETGGLTFIGHHAVEEGHVAWELKRFEHHVVAVCLICACPWVISSATVELAEEEGLL